MGQLIKKENITISIGGYQKDGQTKQKYRTIGEIVTMQGDDGSVYQFGEMWGPGGVTKFNIYAQEDKAAQQQAYQSQPQQAPPQYQQPQQPQQHPNAPPQGQPQGTYQGNPYPIR